MKMLVEGEEGSQGQVCAQSGLKEARVGGCMPEGSLKELRPSLSGEKEWG